MKEQVIRACLVAKKDTIYQLLVFKNLDTNEYIMCTKLPNWDIPEIPLKSKGFISIQETQAGENYYNRKQDTKSTYQYSGVYLTNFVKFDENLEDTLTL